MSRTQLLALNHTRAPAETAAMITDNEGGRHSVVITDEHIHMFLRKPTAQVTRSSGGNRRFVMSVGAGRDC
jgi:hypothetical protein